MRLRTILLIGLSITLMGCLNPIKIKPTKPTLQIIKRDDGGLCLDREDASKLGAYILELENAK